MKLIVALISLIAFSVAPVLAADGRVPDRSLARMGLGGMKILSDAEGLSIRGESIAITTAHSHVSGGFTFISVGTPISIGTHSAFSASASIGIGAFAGSFASASAH